MKMLFLAAALLASMSYGDMEENTATPSPQSRCRSMTLSGNRCKRRARPGTCYCRQHASDVKPSKPTKRCMAMTGDGAQCPEEPLKDRRYCARHVDGPKAKKEEGK